MGAVSGVAIGLIELVGFGVVHALAIVPIWDRLLGGLPLAIAAGLLLGWAYAELASVPGLRRWRPLRLGYGVLVWGSTLRALVTGTLRRTGILPSWLADAEDVIACGLTAASALPLVFGTLRP